VGKSATAIRLAKDFDGEVINCDSMQVYRGFDIGTDKIPPEGREDIPHHLIDVSDPAHQFTAADFVRLAMEAIREIRGRNRLPIITGGTGLYLKALIEGLFPEGRKDPRIRAELEMEAEEKGLEGLYRELMEADPDYGCTIGKRDRVRIIRALEVFRATGKPLSAHFASTRSPTGDFHILQIGLKLEREKLYRRIEDRVERMFARGIVEEVKGLLAAGVRRDAPPFRALGYRQVLKYLSGEITLEEAIAETKKETRRYAKRQMTWFRKRKEIRWFYPDEYSAIARYARNRRP